MTAKSFDQYLENVQDDLQRIAFQRMLPYPNDLPPQTPERRESLAITRAIPFDFLLPIWRKFMPPLFESVSMPEITIDEDNDFQLRKNDIGLAPNARNILTKAASVAMQVGA